MYEFTHVSHVIHQKWGNEFGIKWKLIPFYATQFSYTISIWMPYFYTHAEQNMYILYINMFFSILCYGMIYIV